MLEKNKTSEELLKDIQGIFNKDPFLLEDYIQLRKSFYLLNSVFTFKQITPKNIDTLFEVSSNIANSKKQYRQKTEKVILDFMTYLSIDLFDLDSDSSDEDAVYKAALLLSDFAKKIYTINIPRDAFSGKRKAYAIEILCNLNVYFDTPDFLDIVKKALKNKSKTQFIQVTDSLQEYFEEAEIQPDDDIVKIINKRYDRAKTKSEVMACIQFFVKTKTISEYEALSMLDRWKEENDY